MLKLMQSIFYILCLYACDVDHRVVLPGNIVMTGGCKQCPKDSFVFCLICVTITNIFMSSVCC